MCMHCASDVRCISDVLATDLQHSPSKQRSDDRQAGLPGYLLSLLADEWHPRWECSCCNALPAVILKLLGTKLLTLQEPAGTPSSSAAACDQVRLSCSCDLHLRQQLCSGHAFRTQEYCKLVGSPDVCKRSAPVPQACMDVSAPVHVMRPTCLQRKIAWSSAW